VTEPFDTAETDRLLSTTRSVRKRLDFDRPVPDHIIFECIDLAEQAPSGGNDASRRWIVVKDPTTKARLGDIYRRSGSFMTDVADRLDGTGHSKEQVFSSSAYLVDNFAKAPALVIAAIWGIHDDSGRPGLFDSVLQAAWSFNLALRARGLGTTWTTMLNANVDDLAGILEIPEGVTTVVTFPVAYTIGTDFRPAARRSASEITYFERWGYTRERPSADGDTHLADGQGVVAEVDIAASPRKVWPAISALEPAIRNSASEIFQGRMLEWNDPAAVDPSTTWRIEILDQGVGSRVRFTAQLDPAGRVLNQSVVNEPAAETEIINNVRSTIKAEMHEVLSELRHHVESRSEQQQRD